MNNSYIVTRVGDDNDYISHHGVLGMHWGVRKAEPVSTSYRATSSKQQNSSKGLSSTQKKIVVGAAVVGGLAVLGLSIKTVKARNLAFAEKITKDALNIADEDSIHKMWTQRVVKDVKKLSTINQRSVRLEWTKNGQKAAENVLSGIEKNTKLKNAKLADVYDLKYKKYSAKSDKFFNQYMKTIKPIDGPFDKVSKIYGNKAFDTSYSS